ncbi:hypothetical protein V1524DRAFT_441014 [Lipomyces starkeyi]
MRGQEDLLVRSISSFPTSNIYSAGVRGKYWYFGVNDRMDHADEMGILSSKLRGVWCDQELIGRTAHLD